MRVAIVGSRSITMECYPYIEEYMPQNTTEIVSGGADGADQLAEFYARDHKLPIRIFRPDYALYKRSAPLHRNHTIVDYSDYVLVLWDGHSRGSADVITYCIQAYTSVRVVVIRDGKPVGPRYQ